MNYPGKERASQAVNLGNYAKEILSEDDHPLFDDAMEAGRVGALRAAYVMIWLACAESLKRRFRDAKVRDNTAGLIFDEIERMESQHRAVDRFLLDKAREYGFLSDSGRTILNHVYEMRCIYGHPYQEAPSREKVIDAAAAVVDLVLSRPVKLRHGFGRQLLDNLLNDGNFLDDYEPAVSALAKNILPRLDDAVHVWLLDEYWRELEKISDDSSMAVFSKRGTWFCRAMLTEIGATVLTHEDWHDRLGRFPKTLMGVCAVAGIFRHIGQPAQDSLVGSVLEESKTQASVLNYLEGLDHEGALSQRQHERFIQGIREMATNRVQASGLSTRTLYDKLIETMKSYNWYVQNPTIDTVISNGPHQAADLSQDQQVELGRNILQCGEGTAGSAIEFLEKLSQNATEWPFDVIRGIALESFTNEKNEIRLKTRQLDLVLAALVHLDEGKRGELVAEIVRLVDSGTQERRTRLGSYNEAIGWLSEHEWASPLVKVVEQKLQPT